MNAAPSSALANAFNKSVGATTKGADIPASPNPTDPPAEEWYVAIDEVPVGPIRLTDLRMKYGQGAVKDDSLVWREGFEEWRPLRTLSELHMLVREEVSQPRGSLFPTGAKQATRTSGAGGAPVRSSPTPRPPAGPSATSGGRSNVIPFQRQTGAAARKIDQQFEDDEVTRIAPTPVFPPQESPNPATAAAPAVVEDPFASGPATPAMQPPSSPLAANANVAGAPLFPASVADPHTHAVREPSVVERLSMLSARARGASRGTVALVGAACLLLGVVIAVLVVRRMTVVQEKVVERQVAVPVSVFVPTPGTAPAPTTSEAAAPTSTAPKIAKAGGGATTTSTASTAAPTTTGTKKWGGIDEGPDIPTTGPTSTGGAAAAPLDGNVVQQVAQSKGVAVRKVCYEKLDIVGHADAKVSLHIQPDGSVSQVDLLSGSPPTFASCVQKLAYGWHFPASGSGGTFAIPFLFN